jgi:transaldolase
VATISADIFKKLLSHPLTDKGLAAFLADAKKAGVTVKTD